MPDQYEAGAVKIPVNKPAQRATEKYGKKNYDRIFVKLPKKTNTSYVGNSKWIY